MTTLTTTDHLHPDWGVPPHTGRDMLLSDFPGAAAYTMEWMSCRRLDRDSSIASSQTCSRGSFFSSAYTHEGMPRGRLIVTGSDTQQVACDVPGCGSSIVENAGSRGNACHTHRNTCRSCNDNDVSVFVGNRGEWLCSECTFECTACGTARASSERYDRYDGICYYCVAGCANGCGRDVVRNGEGVQEIDGSLVCHYCARDGSLVCEENGCDNTVLSNMAYRIGGRTYCNTCYRERREVIRDYFYKPDPVFYGTGPYHMGVELEADVRAGASASAVRSIDTVASARQVAKDMPRNLIYTKRDGSLDHGYEIVTHPATPTYWNDISHRVEKMFKGVLKSGLRSYHARSAGMHVHVSRAKLSPLTQWRIQRFFALNEDYIYSVSRRRRSVWNDYCSHNEDIPSDEVYKAKGGTNSDRFRALNFTRHTIEVRIFRGTLNTDGFYRNLGWLTALVEYCRVAPVNKLGADDFISWVLSGEARGKVPKQMLNALRAWPRGMKDRHVSPPRKSRFKFTDETARALAER